MLDEAAKCISPVVPLMLTPMTNQEPTVNEVELTTPEVFPTEYIAGVVPFDPVDRVNRVPNDEEYRRKIVEKSFRSVLR